MDLYGKVIMYIGSCIESIIIIYFFNSIFEVKYNKIFPLLYILLYDSVVTFLLNDLYIAYKLQFSILGYLDTLFIIIVFYKSSWLKKILYYTIFYFGISLVSVPFMLICRLMNIDLSNLYTDNSPIMWICRILSLLLEFAFCQGFAHIIKKRSGSIDRSSSFVGLFTGGILIYNFIILYMFYISMKYSIPSGELILILALATIIVAIFLIITFRSLRKIHRQELIDAQKAEQYKFLYEQYETVQDNYFEYKKLKHDFKDHLLVIDTLAKSGDPEKLNSYIDSIRTELSELDKIMFCNDPAINIIISTYFNISKARGITVNTNISDIQESGIDTVYLCSIISNLLRNAAENTPDNKTIDFDLYTRAENLVIICKNDAERENLTLETTKPNKENHGYGLRIIRDIVERLDGNCIFEYNNKRFSAIINIPIGADINDKNRNS